MALIDLRAEIQGSSEVTTTVGILMSVLVAIRATGGLGRRPQTPPHQGKP